MAKNLAETLKADFDSIRQPYNYDYWLKKLEGYIPLEDGEITKDGDIYIGMLGDVYTLGGRKKSGFPQSTEKPKYTPQYYRKSYTDEL